MNTFHRTNRVLSFILALVLMVGSITVIGTPVSAAEISKSY